MGQKNDVLDGFQIPDGKGKKFGGTGKCNVTHRENAAVEHSGDAVCSQIGLGFLVMNNVTDNVRLGHSRADIYSMGRNTTDSNAANKTSLG